MPLLIFVTSDAVVSFLQEFCLRKKFLQDARNLAGRKKSCKNPALG